MPLLTGNLLDLHILLYHCNATKAPQSDDTPDQSFVFGLNHSHRLVKLRSRFKQSRIVSKIFRCTEVLLYHLFIQFDSQTGFVRYWNDPILYL